MISLITPAAPSRAKTIPFQVSATIATPDESPFISDMRRATGLVNQSIKVISDLETLKPSDPVGDAFAKALDLNKAAQEIITSHIPTADEQSSEQLKMTNDTLNNINASLQKPSPTRADTPEVLELYSVALYRLMRLQGF